MILLIDNYDSFAFNLYQLVGSVNPDIRVIRSDEMTATEIEALAPSHIILSPGPGRPCDAGVYEDVIRELKGKIPIFGVCLGHQAIGEVFGGTIGYAGEIMHGKEDTICGDSGYTGAEKREELQDVDAGFLIAEKPSKLRAMKNERERRYAERWERYKASLRAKVEHPFRVVKRQFGYTKVRYRGLAKNTAQVLTLFALSNVWMARRKLMATG